MGKRNLIPTHMLRDLLKKGRLSLKGDDKNLMIGDRRKMMIVDVRFNEVQCH